jgi:hypothetical protein
MKNRKAARLGPHFYINGQVVTRQPEKSRHPFPETEKERNLKVRFSIKSVFYTNLLNEN